MRKICCYGQNHCQKGNKMNFYQLSFYYLSYLIKHPFYVMKNFFEENKRKNNIMKFRPQRVNTQYPTELKWDERIIYLFEIKNMPGHCVVLSCKTGEIHWGYHIGDFKILDIEEV